MALLTTEQRQQVRALWQGDQAVPPALTKPDFQAAVAACDQWIEDNSASFVAALPQPFRGGTNAAEKALLFAYVLMRRIGKTR